jgi:type I restriction enzyme S subunit
LIANLQPYPEYRESGVPWLGQIPARWEMRRMKLLLREVDSRSSTGREQLLRVSQYTGVTQRRALDGSDSPDTRASSLVGYKRVTPNDLVINIMLAWNGSMGVSRFAGIASPAYCVYRLKDGARPWYYHELLRLPLYKGRIKTASTGVVEIRLRLYSDDLGRIEAIQPPTEDQDAIVRFIDYANGRLERAIRAKRKVIALLHEQKQAIIHRAVTRGLDPTVPLQPSGIPWLGDIPKHWEVKRIKYLLREVDRRSTTGTEPLLSMRMHHGLVLFASHFTRPPQAASLVGFKIVRPGQFVVNRMQAGNGVIYASKLHGLVSPDYAVFDPIGEANMEFLGELFRSRKVRAKFRAESKGLGTGTSGFLRLYNDRLGAIHVALPPPEEQALILRGLADELSGMNATITRLEREIALLREYRTRLVADVVTGKLDVRRAVPKMGISY